MAEMIKSINPNHKISFGMIDFDKFTVDDLKDRRDYFLDLLLERAGYYEYYLGVLANEYKIVDEYLKLKICE